ncbi:nuclear transport factor 2 family protein [Sphingomonas flavescens]|uniref:nuclear transport factor 2 family protein n=1 Tax=Sphingomonas flavescens TaxID=3132797 RepID=UPI002803838C|nr:nuclear transport factor 2 family protein [Sphingomonas limnosediminicola]
MFTILLALAAQSPSTKLPPAQALPPPTVDQQAVLAPINAAFAAFETGDSAAMLRYVVPEGRVTAVGKVPDGSDRVRLQSFTEFAARLKPGEGFKERITDPAIEIDGNIAMVWAPFTVEVGGKLETCGTDHFDLIRQNGEWKIMNVTFSSRTTGCGK